jgi:diguanylate cyclase (GGDEF)-like protein
MTRRRPTALIVVADGDAPRRAASTSRLTGAGYRVMATATTGEALACCRAADPDLFILDADLEGAEPLLNTLRGTRGLQSIPIITLSADARVDRVIECLQRGARDHLRVPFAVDELVARAQVALHVGEEHQRLRRRNNELEFLGAADEVTGLPNRRHLEQQLDRLAAAAARHHQPLAAVMLAIDEAEALEARGTDIADAVHQEVAFLLEAVRRTGDVPGRFADHSFLVLLPMTDNDGARVFAERMRAVVAAAPFPTPEGPVEVSLSAGCADGATGPAELRTRAQKALDRAQAAGGNTLVCISA